MQRFRDPALSTIFAGLGVLLTLILGLFSFGGLLYANGQHGWGITLFIIGGILSTAVLSVLSFWPIRRAFSWLRRIRIHLTPERDGCPPEYQWLLDIAREDAENPVQHLLILEQKIADMDLRPDRFRPWIELGFTLYNGGVHDILVGSAEGHANYKGNELPDSVEASRGGSRKPRGHVHEYRLKQYLPTDVAEALYEEIANTGKVRSLSLSGVRIEVESEGQDGRNARLQLGASDTFPLPD